MLERRTPLDSVQAYAGRHGPTIEHVGLRVSPVRGRGLLLLQTTAAPALQESLAQELGLALPSAQTATLLGHYALLWLTPAEWLLELPVDQTDAVHRALTRQLTSALAAVTDFSDALMSIEISGEHAAEVLATGCSLDLRPHAFPSSRVARTALADIPAILWNPGGADRYRCLVDRGFAAHLLAWLDGAAPP